MAEIVVGNVGNIVSVARKIKEAVETVRRNKEECSDIAKCVTLNSALLMRLEEETEITKDKAIRDALENVKESLEEALALVTKCQHRPILCRFFGAGDMANQLHRVKEDIVQKIMQASFANGIYGTIIMTYIQHACPPPPPPPRPSPREGGVTNAFRKFSLSQLKDATNNFSYKNIIGRGGLAVIYKGVLRNGLAVAIKRFRSHASTKFRDEFGIGLKLQHKNVVNVLGYCIDVKLSVMQSEGKYVEVEERQNFLVLRYVPNGSLRRITEGNQRIDWSSCFRIIQGIAESVSYLHEKCVVHMDLKPVNILFDSDMNHMIISFGSSIVLDHDDDEKFVEGEMGTLGYIAPECIEKGLVSTKCDVFAFGITLRQIISSMCTTSKTLYVWEPEQWDRMVEEAGGLKGLLDPTLQLDESQVMEIQRCKEVAVRCTQRYPKDRPTMADVVKMLKGDTEMSTPKKTDSRA